MSLKKWFNERWVNIGKKKKDGSYADCGRSDANKGKYPKCVPLAKALSMSKKDKQSAVRRKRLAEKVKKRIDKNQLMLKQIGNKMSKDFQLKKEHKSKSGGLSEKGRKAYNRATGSNLKRPVSLKEAVKSKRKAARRKSFCARMSGMKKRLTSAKTARDPNSRINKALRKWDC